MLLEGVETDGLLQVMAGPRELALVVDRGSHGIMSREELQRAAGALSGCQGLACQLAGSREVSLDVVVRRQFPENPNSLGQLAGLGDQRSRAIEGPLALGMRPTPGGGE